VADHEPEHADFMRQWVNGDKAIAIPGVQLAKNEQFYLSDFNAPPEASIQATADVRFAFEKWSTDPQDPSKEVAVFLLSKQFKGKAGAPNVWLEKPEVFKLSKGDTLGGKVQIQPPNEKLKREYDLTTPFLLDDIKHDVDRIWYYELKVVPRATPGKDRDLAVTAVTKKTDVAVLKNSKTGASLELTKLADVRRPTRVGSIYYPVYPAEIYEEDKEFLKSPADFQQWGLKPPEPVKHEPGTGPLEELHEKTGDGIYKTDTAYFEMPDGRLFWWEPINHQLMRDPPEAEEKPKDPKANVPKAPPGAKPKAPPAGVKPPPPPKAPPGPTGGPGGGKSVPPPGYIPPGVQVPGQNGQPGGSNQPRP